MVRSIEWLAWRAVLEIDLPHWAELPQNEWIGSNDNLEVLDVKYCITSSRFDEHPQEELESCHSHVT
jgi:hypothetical protein